MNNTDIYNKPLNDNHADPNTNCNKFAEITIAVKIKQLPYHKKVNVSTKTVTLQLIV